MMTKSRIIQFDFIRGACMLYIVGFYHLNNYLHPDLWFSGIMSEIVESMTTAVLATFTFISGYMLRRYEFRSWDDVKVFYRKRLLRFYPLFILSAVGLYIMRYIDLQQLIFGISGLALFTEAPLKTLWFISMLMLLYAFTPIIRCHRLSQNGGGKLLVLGMIVILLIILYLTGTIEKRLLIYAPLYVIGLSMRDLNYNKKTWLVIALVSFVAIMVIMLFDGMNEVAMSCLLALFGVSLIVAVGFLLPINNLEKPISFFAYSSMAAYMFHRHIYGASLLVFGIRDGENIYLTWWSALLVLLVIFVASWGIQTLYDKSVTRLLKTSK